MTKMRHVGQFCPLTHYQQKKKLTRVVITTHRFSQRSMMLTHPAGEMNDVNEFLPQG
jgi:hypothetical protein